MSWTAQHGFNTDNNAASFRGLLWVLRELAIIAALIKFVLGGIQ